MDEQPSDAVPDGIWPEFEQAVAVTTDGDLGVEGRTTEAGALAQLLACRGSDMQRVRQQARIVSDPDLTQEGRKCSA